MCVLVRPLPAETLERMPLSFKIIAVPCWQGIAWDAGLYRGVHGQNTDVLFILL